MLCVYCSSIYFNIVLYLVIFCSFIIEMRKNALLIVLQIVIIEHKSIICPGYNAVLHIHTCIEEVEITVSVLWSYDVHIGNLLVGVRSLVMIHMCRATKATKLQPWMESLVSTGTQPKMAVTVSISLLKSVVNHGWLSYTVNFRRIFLLFLSIFFPRPLQFCL